MAYMRPRTPITREQILAALDASDHDVDSAAALLQVSGRTLYRRMRDMGIRKSDRYEAAEAA